MWQRVTQFLGLSYPPTPSPQQLEEPPTTAIPPCSDLYDLVLDLDWDRVVQHCHDHPQDAHFQEGDGLETPLYLACQWHPPLNVIQALIEANPEALQWTSREFRDLPLHMVCRYATTTAELLREFVTRYPAGACHATKYGKTPLQVLWEFSRPNCMKQPPDDELTNEEQVQVDAFWEKMELLVQAVAKSRQQTGANAADFKVHAVVSLGSLGCPHQVLEYICRKYPHQLQLRDPTGQLPLHVAVGPTQWSGKRKYKPRERATIRLLLELYPEAARTRWCDNSGATTTTTTTTHRRSLGRYPLHVALANRHTWQGGVQELFLAATEVLGIRDPVTRLHPFQLAAIPVQDHLAIDVGTIVELLRQQPELLQVACDNNSAEPSEERRGGAAE